MTDVFDGTRPPAVPDDDQFHPVTEPTHWWTETNWFSFMVPERNLMAYLYAWVRPVLGTVGGGVVIWDDTAEEPWQIPYYDYQWMLPHDPDADLRDIVYANGIHHRVLEPLTRYQLTYAKADLVDLEVTFDAVEPPHKNGTHIDQIGRMTGRLTLHGDELAVDCLAMRDRTWGPRSDKVGMGQQVGYCWGNASADEGFLLFTNIDDEGRDRVARYYGYLRRDGVVSSLRSGERDVERVDGKPQRISMTATDELGRELAVSGEARNRLAFSAYPSMFCWLSLMRWEYPDGRVAWGENQDVYPPHAWRRR